MPAAGDPVASITMSTSGSAIIRALSSKKRTEPIAASAQPTRWSASFARAGLRSAIAVIRTPGVCRAWDRYIEPNLPAPIRPTRSGLSARFALLQQAMQVHRRSPWLVTER